MPWRRSVKNAPQALPKVVDVGGRLRALRNEHNLSLRALADSPPGVPWYGFARVGRELADGDFCVALKRSGCVMLQLGLESGDQGVLDALQKGVEIETASQVLKNLQKAGIATYVYLLFGAPPETVTEARRTLKLFGEMEKETAQ